MEMGPIGAVLLHIRQLASAKSAGHLTDAQLLERFLTDQDEGTIATLLHRHGPMVWRVCQRVLRHRHDAEDVFQATFLTLVRKAAAIRKHESLASWLHGVAYRLGRRLKAQQVRAVAAVADPASPARNPADQASGQEVQAVFDEELDRLAEQYRLPLILCCLEGKTRDEAAEQLGWSLSTLKRRLDRGRKLLSDRLTRRGVTLGVALFSAVLSQNALTAAVPPALLNSTWNASTLIAAGRATAEVVSTPVAALTEGMVKALTVAKLKLAAVLTAALLTLGGGAGLWITHVRSGTETPAVQTLPTADKPETQASQDLARLDKDEKDPPPPAATGVSDVSPKVQDAGVARVKHRREREDDDDDRPKISGRTGKETDGKKRENKGRRRDDD